MLNFDNVVLCARCGTQFHFLIIWGFILGSLQDNAEVSASMCPAKCFQKIHFVLDLELPGI